MTSKKLTASQISTMVSKDLKDLFNHGFMISDPKTGDIHAIVLSKSGNFPKQLESFVALADFVRKYQGSIFEGFNTEFVDEIKGHLDKAIVIDK